MGDFLGFTFGGVHSSDLGITRVSGGDRYGEELHPEIKDRIAEVPGLNGNYYFGSDFGPKTINIDIAFDSLTEQQFRKLRQIFGVKKVQSLIFDECPYKQYMAKIESPIKLSYICFDEPNYTWQQRDGIGRTQIEREDHDYKVYDGTMRSVYKGEGTISFICYFPFAKSVFKTIPEEYKDNSWVISSGILSSEEYSNIDRYINLGGNTSGFKVYNAGDIATGFRLYLSSNILNQNISLIYENDIGEDVASLHLKPITLKNQTETGIMIDTNTGLITGVQLSGSNYILTNNLYNEYIESGFFFLLDPNSPDTTSELIVEGVNNNASNIQIFYDYLYF